MQTAQTANVPEILSCEQAFADSDLEVWIYHVQVRIVDCYEGEHILSCKAKLDTQRIHITVDNEDLRELPPSLRVDFNWNDWMLDNVEGNGMDAAMLCSLAVAFSPIFADPTSWRVDTTS